MGAVQLATLLCLVACHTALGVSTPSTTSPEDRIQQLESVTKQLARQLMLQQLYVEEKTRSEGDSGLKQVPELHFTPNSYFCFVHLKSVLLNLLCVIIVQEL